MSSFSRRYPFKNLGYDTNCVESALCNVFPQATRRICCQHLYSNCKNEGFSGTAFHKLFWTAADAYNQYVYTKAMEKIAKYNPKAIEYLEKCTEQWSRAFIDSGVCCDQNTTNFVESFNACTKPYRDLPVITLLEDYAKMILESRSDESRFCYATSCGGGEYEVRDGNVTFPITLTNYKCGCGKWQGSGIPCKHALRVIFNQRLEPADFLSPFFKGAAYKLTYGDHIHPMPDPTQWPDFNLPQIAPPDIKRPAGRPVKQIRRGPNEAKKGKRHSSVRCKKCKEVGHNSRTCGTDKGKGKGSKRKADGASTSQAAPKRAKKTSRADGASTSEAAPKRGKK
ncbi:uncharacterized protein LOC104906852 [Beta vulgaris subsp. vulgaris]|uniref:uncharacterized protein LOC104906852 n=1 Tax=Beta vulgaris subsp. vulgaris TaxID=3555 RepID=UPI0020374DB7|nr:uncharacterized protein LOC104906852 [Beta vulgaris subsp. vulgaris]